MSSLGGFSAELHLTGALRLIDASGHDRTPSSAKAQALLALVATSPTASRSRSWLKSKLWSDRAPEQASGSLRQALVQLRKVFEAFPDVLRTDRKTVTLDVTRVRIVLEGDGEFLEGIDIQDEAFEDWLRQARQSRPPAPPIPPNKRNAAPSARPAGARRLVHIRASGSSSDTEWLARLVCDNVSRLVKETFSVEIACLDGDSPEMGEQRIDVEAQALTGGSVGVRVALTNLPRRSHLWSDSRVVDARGGPPHTHPEIVQLGNRLVEAMGDELFLAPDLEGACPDTLCRRGISKMFAIRPDTVAAADEMFARAYDLNPRGLYLAWRAQAKTIMKIERHGHDARQLAEEAEALCARALELEPNNSMVLATVANTHGQLFRQYETGAFYASRSVALNPCNPMTWFALSSTSMYAGDSKTALRYAIKANRLAMTSPHRFWWDSQVFGAALVLGRLEEAEHFAEKCYAQNTDFRPPMRYLIALYANTGRDEDAVEMAARLSALEPDFSLERLIRDQDYPASVLHRDIGIDLERVAALQ